MTVNIVSTGAPYRRSSMLFTSLAVALVLVAVLVGGSSRAATRAWLAGGLAAVMVAAQFALLMTS